MPILLVFLLILATELSLNGSPLQDGRSSATDPVKLLRLAVANYNSRELTLKDYTYVENERGRTLLQTVSNTYEIILLDGRPYRRHTKFNGQPLPPEEEKDEQARLDAARRKIMKEGDVEVLEKPTAEESADPQIAAMRASEAQERKDLRDADDAARREGWGFGTAPRRLAMLPEFKKTMLELRLPLQQLPNGFEIRLKGEEVLNGRKTWALEAIPIGPFKTAEETEPDAQNFKLKIWIDEAEIQIVKAEGKVIRAGFLSRIVDFALDPSNLSPEVEAKIRKLMPESKAMYSRGTVVTMQWARVNNEAWLPSEIHIKGTAEVHYPKPQGKEVKFVTDATPVEYDDIVFSDYKKFRVDARILPQN